MAPHRVGDPFPSSRRRSQYQGSTRSYSLRERAKVKYYDNESDDFEDFDEFDEDDEEEGPAKKKRKGNDAKTQTAMDKPLPKHKIFPFKLLPGEIKNKIYHLALIDHNGIYLISKLKNFRRGVQRDVPGFPNSNNYSASYRRRFNYPAYPAGQGPKPDTLVPNILLLDREIHNETRPILYSCNTFHVEDTRAMHAFLANIGANNCATLTNLVIKGYGEGKAHKAMNHPGFTLLSSAVNLEHLFIDCLINKGGGPVMIARQFYRDSYHYLEGIAAVKGKFDAAIDIINIANINFTRNRYGLGRQTVSVHEEDMKVFGNELRKLLRAY